ncbi:hypothetical protein [Streptomyces asiaticus]|uniref:hypothetical protein n=1 Tax=Streptomyces asiaticus TaxID=114695 RepID=UPI0037FD033C
MVAETGAGRILRVDDTDTAGVLAEGLDHPLAGVPGRPRQFAGLAVAPDGALLVSANGEGSVLRLDAPAG